MAITNNSRLFYVNDRSELRAVDVDGSNLQNEVFSNIRTLYKSEKKVTALHLENIGQEERIYLGVQDGLMIVDGNGTAKSVKGMEDKYITTKDSILPFLDRKTWPLSEICLYQGGISQP